MNIIIKSRSLLDLSFIGKVVVAIARQEKKRTQEADTPAQKNRSLVTIIQAMDMGATPAKMCFRL